MPASTTLANSILNILYRAVARANMWDNAAASPDTNVYATLHSAPLTAAAVQTTTEAAYTNADRVAIGRTTGAWTAPASGVISNVAAVEFPTCGVTGETEDALSLGRLSSGGGDIHHFGDLNVSIPVAETIQPRFIAGAITITIT